MVKENEVSTKSRKAPKQIGRQRKKSVSSKAKNSSKFVSCEVKNKRLLSKWKPINPSLINMLQRIQHNHAVPILVNESCVSKAASNLLCMHQEKVVQQCKQTIGPDKDINFQSLKKAIKAASTRVAILQRKCDYLDSQIPREQRNLDSLKDSVEVVKQ